MGLAAAWTAADKTLIQRQIATAHRQIDRLVYELYGLSDAENQRTREPPARLAKCGEIQ